ncbi:MAG: sugar diacid recognition domain-containing protein [Hespellia sp.]|nr:sugar diacid recognition domain-containing protein [Hespellia sp.]
MIKNIDQQLAQQIVDTVKDVCGKDINFIEPSGMILASTNAKRIGSFHEIGQQAATQKTPIEVTSDEDYSGTEIGVNIPIYHNKSILAVIGISGDPNEVRKYAYLAERISNLLIRERELSTISRKQADKKQFILDSLIRNEPFNHEYLKDCLKSFHVDVKSDKRILLLHINPQDNPTTLALVEQKIEQLFEYIHLSIYAFHYPNEYLAIIDSVGFDWQTASLREFADSQKEILKIAVGKSTPLYQLSDSYQTALTALHSLSETDDVFVLFDNLTLEIILSDVKENNRDAFCHKILHNLNEEELQLIRIYFESEMSLVKTCDRLFLHKNTLQYKLNHIYQKCGLNPRAFRDAVPLYLALRLK